MSKIQQTSLNSLNNKFNGFTRKISGNKKPNIPYICSQIQHFEKQYAKINAIDFFVKKCLQFANELKKIGLNDIAGIIFSNLAKIPILSKENKELVILSGLKHAKDNEDVIHVLSRLVDLKFLYKNENSKKKYIKTLQEEEKYLTLIINDYFQSTQKYKTINRGANSVEKYKFRLATSKVDLAKALLRTEPNIALKKLNEANNIFTDLNKNKEIGFVKLLIQEIKK